LDNLEVCRVMREIALASMLLAIAPSAIAQEIPDPAAEARIHLGPLAFSPTLSLVNAGVDTNVFYEPDQLTPKRDFTITFQPKTDWWLRIGRTWLVGTVTEALVYYNTYASERSVNGFYKLGWLVPMTRFTFRADGSYLTTRERPGFEIDARSQRYEVGVDGNLEIRVLSKTFIGIRGLRQRIDYDKAAVFLNQNLQFEL